MFPTSQPVGSNQPEPVQTSAHPFEQEWMDVAKAVVFCAELGLVRTPKTIRKWAERSSGIPDGDVLSRKEDTPWGYRWMIEKASLTRKVEEEIELRSANQSEQVHTGSVATEPEIVLPVKDVQGENPYEPVQTSAHSFTPNVDQSELEIKPEPSANTFEPVQTRSEIELVLDEVRERIGDKDDEIAFLRDQLSEAQAEIGRRASSTDEALKTIDRVVRSFEMQAEANRALALGAGQSEPEFPEQTRPMSFAPDSVDTPSRH